MMMSYAKFIMYLATVPDYDYDGDDSDSGEVSNKNKVTGSFNLFDIEQRMQ